MHRTNYILLFTQIRCYVQIIRNQNKLKKLSLLSIWIKTRLLSYYLIIVSYRLTLRQFQRIICYHVQFILRLTVPVKKLYFLRNTIRVQTITVILCF